jgi:dienelactone hydrolase
LLSRRLVAAIDWLASERGYVHGSIGCFGTGAGAAAALIAAAHRPHLVGAVVTAGGRSDLAGAAALAAVHAPTLLIVGDEDPAIADANRTALSQLRCESDLRVVHGAGPRFDQPGALAALADLAGHWFNEQLESVWSRSVDQPANL